jgi:hypothetical protein
MLTGIAQTLDDAGAATYRPNTAYQPDETAVVFGTMPPSPDRCVALAIYGPSDDHPNQPIGQMRVQVRVRGLPGNYLDAVALLGDCFGALHGLTHQQWGAMHVNQLLRLSGGPLGPDDSQRWEYADNYQADTETAPTALRPH